MKLLLILNLILVGAVSMEAHETAPLQDITGAAASIFKRPENPTIHGGQVGKENKQRSSKDVVRDQVDDAIALGNAARDRKPPDFQSAEKAYRLALKLDPRDPRPYLGLANLFWDQQRYPEAASSYRDAVRQMTRNAPGLYTPIFSAAGIGFGVSKGRKSAFQPNQIQLYLAAALLESRDALGAERELRLIALSHSDNAEWNALFGYALAAQGQYTEAVAALEKAVKLQPTDEKNQEMLKEIAKKARETSAKDQEIANRLQNTVWKVQDPGGEVLKGTCQLVSSGAVRCTKVRSDLALLNATWKIRDGVVRFEETSKVQFCRGHLSVATLDVKCYTRTGETNELWTLHR